MRGGKWLGALKPQSRGVGVYLHLRMLTGRQILGHGRQSDRCEAGGRWSDDRKTLLFSSLFQRGVPGDGIHVSCHPWEQQWDPRCGTGAGGGGTLAEPPDIIPSTDLAGCISAWDGAGKKLQSALPGAVEIRTSCCLLFILWSHTLPKAVF